MKVLIIEDEHRAANQLQKLLVTCRFDYQLEGIIDTVEDSVKWFQSNPAPDLVFMDIQLADGLSFEIFQEVKLDCPIIFTTAFDQYAIQAFKVNSVDYLLKPIQEADLQRALDKFDKSKSAPVLSADLLSQLLAGIQAPTTPQREGILVKDGGGFVQVKLNDIFYFYAEDSLVFGITSKKRYLIEETIDHLIGTLDASQFYKINRGQIVSKRSIAKIDPYFNHRVKLKIQNDRDLEFIVSRQKTSDFKKWMNH